MAWLKNNLTRRQFMQRSGAVAAACSLAGRAGMVFADEWIKRSIPSSGELLPAVGLGTSGGITLDQRETAKTLMRRFVELGGTVVDSSPMYGIAEETVGTIAAELGIVDDLFMATKVWTTGKAAGIQQMAESARLMQKPVLDLIQVHNLVDLDTNLETLKEMKAAGKVRYVGVTHYQSGTHDELVNIIERGDLDFVQFNYSLADRYAERRLLPAAQSHGVATLINRPYADGAMFSRVRGKALPDFAQDIACESFGQIYLKFVLSHPAVTCVIPGTSKVHHMEDNMGALRGNLPDTAMRQRIQAWFEKL